MPRPLKLLAGVFQGGGNIPLILPILAELISRGHDLHVIVGPGVRRSRLKVSPALIQELDELGARIVLLRENDNHPFDQAGYSERGLFGSWTPRSFQNVQRAAQSATWAPIWAEDVSDELSRESFDLVIADFVLLGALIAAEAARIPAVALMHTIYPWPTVGVPAFGPGHLPKTGLLGFCRDSFGRAVVERLWARNGLEPVNSARSSAGLRALKSPLQQYDAAARVLVLVSPEFDWPAPHWPANVRHIGTPGDKHRATNGDSVQATDSNKPLVIVALSTLEQGQAGLLERILVSLADLPIQALVTLGPALESKQFVASPNVRLEKFVPHDLVLPGAAVLVTQCGIGTLTKALRYGVPMVCLPLTGDQYDNAARIVSRGAGVRLDRQATADQIRSAIARVMQDQAFKQGAKRLADAMALEPDPAKTAADEIEQAARLASTG
jgi:MGT family glycosyltransferase